MEKYANRPRPILEAIRGGGWKTILGTLLAAAVSFGVLNAEQATALDNLVAAVVTLVTFATSAVAQFHVLDNAEPLVTPVAAPHDDADRPLVPAADPEPPPLM
ncbi:hypothetical protein [Saccharopolyspora phatthalungensis]|uniref:Holin n=1 Tax=Saccharopolyspora phatthalungensis TaxID=664693 RepID=A0A840PXD2_9PSEU|nr:hypothetical protein [Saccharopolyspora phatthalungensis]MBB5154942.1 hypothetical protein [Saccharopolyspora phatthalungensis]